jgi:hypothetical protein
MALRAKVLGKCFREAEFYKYAAPTALPGPGPRNAKIKILCNNYLTGNLLCAIMVAG